MIAELVYDSKAAHLKFDCPYDPAMHELLPDYPWVKALRRLSHNPKLFLYRHRVTGRFILCAWVLPPEKSQRPCFTELEGFTDEPQRGYPADALPLDLMIDRLIPVQEGYARLLRQKREQQSQKRITRESDLAHRNSVSKYLRKMGMGREADLMDCGALPVLPLSERDPDAHEEKVDRLVHAVKRM